MSIWKKIVCRGNKTLSILSFQVEPGSLVNLGTLEIAVLGKPEEMLIGSNHSMEGAYTYQYGYKRSEAGGSYSDPMSWFAGRKGKAVQRICSLSGIAVSSETVPRRQGPQ